MKQSIGKRRISARRELKMQRGELGSSGAARISDDELAPAIALRLEILHDRRQRFRRITANHEDRVGLCDILHRERHAAVDAECAQPSSRRRRHAETSVVVDVRRLESHSRELAKGICLLVGKTAAAENADGIAAVRGREFTQLQSDQIERFIPACGAKFASLAITYQRCLKSLGRIEQLSRCPTLTAQSSTISWEISGGDAPYAVSFGETHATLHGAIWTMRFGGTQ